MKVSVKLTIGFFVIISLIWVTVFFALNTYTKTYKEIELLKDDIVPGVIAMTDMKEKTHEIKGWLFIYITEGNVLRQGKPVEEWLQECMRSLEETAKEHREHETHIDPEEQKIAEELESKVKQLNSGVVEIVNLKDQDAEVDELLEKMQESFGPGFLPLIKQLGEHKAMHVEELAESEKAVQEAYTSGVRFLLLIAILVTFLAGVVGLSVAKSIVNPLRALHKGTEEIAQGNLDYRVGIKAKDEIGQFSRAFDRMTADLKRSTVSINNLNEEIARRKKTEEARQRKHILLKVLMDTIPDSIYFKDKKCRFVIINKTKTEHSGIKPEDMIGKTDFDFLPREQAEKSFRDDKHVMEIGSPLIDIIEKITHPDKTEHWISATKIPWYDKGNLMGTIGISRDITQRKQVEKALRESEEKHRKIFELSPEAIILLDPKGNIVNINKKLHDWLGYKPEEVIGRNLSELPFLSEESKVKIREKFSARLLGKNTPPYELDFITKSGKKHIGKIFASLIKDKEGKIIQDLAMVSNITEDKRLQDELRQAKEDAEVANRAKSDFLANMSHEIRTPMNTIVGMGDLLSETQLLPEQQQYIHTLQTAGETLLSLISDILDLSKIEGGHLDLEEIDFDLGELIEKIGQIIAMRAHKKGLELSYQVMPDVPNSLTGDPDRLRQILINLITNAIKFTKKGEVLVEVQYDKDRAKTKDAALLRFSVKDTGIGIPREKLNSIFDSFIQVSSSVTRQYGGTGLGLTISQRLIGLMGGRIWVQSKVGQGSTFYFTAQFGIQTQPKKPITLPLVDLSGLKVLVIDDNATNRMILNKVLTRWEMLVTEVESGKQGIAELERAQKNNSSFQLVLLDSRMPGMSGLEVAEYIKKETSLAEVTIIMLTSDARSEEKLRCRELGLSGYLIKPISPSKLLDTITAAIGHKRIAGEAAGTVMKAIPVKGKDSLHILLVEDSKDNRLLIQAHLKRTPYQIDIAENGRIAIEKFTSKKYDLVFMDIQMPIMDGYSATKAIRKWEREKGVKTTPIIALTAHAFKEDMQKSLDAGCTDHITKPIRKQLLLKVIHKYAQAILKKEVSDEAPHKKIAVRVPEEIKDLIPGFLAHRAEDVRTLGEKLKRGDFQTIQILGHSMKGSGAGYGFDAITDIGGLLEQAAKNKDIQRIQQQIDRLSTYLEGLEVTYE